MINKILIATFFCSIFFIDNIHAENIQYSKIKEGDIIFRKEDSFLSNRFEKMDGRGFSHIGIVYIKEKYPYVLHIERNDKKNDLKVVKIETFLNKSTKYKIKRLKGIYNTTNMTKKIKKILLINPRFDFYFDLSTDNTLYCTELIYKLYKETYGITLTTERSSFGFYTYISVGSIVNSTYLQDI
ncbi:MAG: YiiX/YebB-like N1pC/P60 family cysteine hydrolase [Campylobacterota bacterium]|nr:YiiX/YebB-like N1pC/P60 family cysteine hydrolase [Campylobacterota bacterium]